MNPVLELLVIGMVVAFHVMSILWLVQRKTGNAGIVDVLSADLGVGTTGVAGPDPHDGQATGSVWMGAPLTVGLSAPSTCATTNPLGRLVMAATAMPGLPIVVTTLTRATSRPAAAPLSTRMAACPDADSNGTGMLAPGPPPMFPGRNLCWTSGCARSSP